MDRLKEKRLVIMDLDNTILHTDKTISDYTKKVISSLEGNNIKTIISTARIFPTAKKIYDELNCSGISYSNGAMIICDNQVLAQNLMNFKSAKEMLNTIEKNYPHILVSVMYDDIMYTNYYHPNTIKIDTWDCLPQYDIQRVLLRNTKYDDCDNLKESYWDKFYIQKLENNNILVVSKFATKENALTEILKHFLLGYENVIAFGDDINDIEFMRKSGLCVAVDNAVDEVKKIADYICNSNDEDGVARWLEQKLLR
ncbi:MAG: HAD-IIB family hydrolase [Desulfosporosinus sp.]|nr:HAD-IIB family hydrolase [Desulfosporosinus sp.]